jgi:hypothetical protein
MNLKEQGQRMAEAVAEERAKRAKDGYYLEVHEALAKIREKEASYAKLFDAHPLSDDYLCGLIQGLRIAESYVKRISA